MSRFAAILLISALGFAACAHDPRERRDVAAMEDDSPVISPWSGSLPNDPIQQERLYTRGAGDEK